MKQTSVIVDESRFHAVVEFVNTATNEGLISIQTRRELMEYAIEIRGDLIRVEIEDEEIEHDAMSPLLSEFLQRRQTGA